MQKITVYEVKADSNSKESFIITATSKYDTRTLGGGSSSPRTRSKHGSGSSEDKATAQKEEVKETYQVMYD